MLFLSVYFVECCLTWAGGERGNILIWIDWFALNWDRGLVNCGTNILCGCWISWQNQIQVLLHWYLSFQNLSPFSPSTSSHHPLALISFHYLPYSIPAYFFINGGNPLSITPLISPDFRSSLNCPLLSSPPQCCTWFWFVCVRLINPTSRVKLGLWSCQLWYEHLLWVLTLLIKWDSGLLLEGLHNCCGKQIQRGVLLFHAHQ